MRDELRDDKPFRISSRQLVLCWIGLESNLYLRSHCFSFIFNTVIAVLKDLGA